MVPRSGPLCPTLCLSLAWRARSPLLPRPRRAMSCRLCASAVRGLPHGGLSRGEGGCRGGVGGAVAATAGPGRCQAGLGSHVSCPCRPPHPPSPQGPFAGHSAGSLFWKPQPLTLNRLPVLMTWFIPVVLSVMACPLWARVLGRQGSEGRGRPLPSRSSQPRTQCPSHLRGEGARALGHEEHPSQPGLSGKAPRRRHLSWL